MALGSHRCRGDAQRRAKQL